MAASRLFKNFRSALRGYGNIFTGIIVGAGLTKIYFESTVENNKKTYNKKQIQRIINTHENLKWGKQLRNISGNLSEEDKALPQNYGFQDNSILKYGLPEKATDNIMYKNHALCYDRARKTPRWVVQHLTRDRIKGEANRSMSEFKPDLNIPPQFQARNEDYLGSGWSRGHMTPAGDNRFDQEAMNESFYLTNIVPQDFDNNGGFWYRMEGYCRHLTRRYSDVYVISGPLYLPQEENGNRVVKYQVIGESNVAVPTHLYKVIVAEAEDKPPVFGAFVVPNQPIGYDYSLQDFQVSLERLEKDSGLIFFPSFDDSIALDLCDTDGCKLMSKEMMEMIQFGRRLRNSINLDDLESVWVEMKEKGAIPDKFTVEIYEKRKAEVTVDSESDASEMRENESGRSEKESEKKNQKVVVDDNKERTEENREMTDKHPVSGEIVGHSPSTDDNLRESGVRQDSEADKDVIIFSTGSSGSESSS